MIERNKLGRFLSKNAKNKLHTECLTCKKDFVTYVALKRKYCSRTCYQVSQNKNGTRLNATSAERSLAYYRMNKAKNKCECGALKVKKSLACKSCSSKNRSGEKSPYWKGGMVARLAHNRMRAQKMKQLKDHSQEEWQELKQTYGHMCLCCKRTEPDIKLQKDHIVPISKGGADNIENIQPLCGSCNSQKYTSIIDYRSQLILKS